MDRELAWADLRVGMRVQMRYGRAAWRIAAIDPPSPPPRGPLGRWVELVLCGPRYTHRYVGETDINDGWLRRI